MGLSTNCIVHFTKNKTNLKGILKHGFRVKYCYEHIDTNGKIIRGAFPMISFCNIPLSEIKSHISKYGKYGIGLNKSWAIQKGLNPVIYMEKESTISEGFSNSLSEHIMKDKKLSELDPIEESIIDIVRYMKNYENDLKRDNKTIKKNYRFFDEHEWRYIPLKLDLHDSPMVIHESKYRTQEQKDKANSKIENLYLNFVPDDIKYILIKNENEISDILNFIEQSFGKNHPSETIKRLFTRILTVDQIKSDF